MGQLIQRSMWGAAAIAGVMAGLPAQAASDAIAAVRAATAKYMDVNVALAQGFVPAPSGCITAKNEGLPPEWGAMGVHYINPAMLKLTGSKPRVSGMSIHTDVSKPSILLYEPQADGSLQLVGVENLVFQQAWKDAGNTEAPKFAGQTWTTMADNPSTSSDEAHAFEPHYDIHVWTERENPKGALVPFNTNVTCEFFKE